MKNNSLLSSAEQIISFMNVVEKLCHVKRYTLMQNGEHERDSDHIMKLAFLAMMVMPYIKHPINQQRVLELVLVHDLVEADAGDVPLFDQLKNPELKVDKKAQEMNAISKYRDILPYPLGEKIYDLFMEFEKQETFEAKLVKVLDKFEGNIQCNKENHGARYYAQALTPIMDAMKSHKFSFKVDEEIIFALEDALIAISENNIEWCKDNEVL